ncbi:hypothetical protein [Maritalea mediterranea]|uniref:DUF1515 domain-containing protein n=1 Tax=Maritalea mediterranea TaxID=2909667 RepID=A0ABS9E8T3_9HYPH|nr:hypothetical protein [Maritalea mediterranea]MCF4098604.1 hypothetical protein [Maritalea mediterranea]
MTDNLPSTKEGREAFLLHSLGRIEGKQDQINERLLQVLDDQKHLWQELDATKKEHGEAIESTKFRLNLFTGIGMGAIGVLGWLSNLKGLLFS